MKIRSPNAAIAALDFVTRPIKRTDSRMLQPVKIGWGRRGPVYQDKRGRIHQAADSRWIDSALHEVVGDE